MQGKRYRKTLLASQDERCAVVALCSVAVARLYRCRSAPHQLQLATEICILTLVSGVLDIRYIHIIDHFHGVFHRIFLYTGFIILQEYDIAAIGAVNSKSGKCFLGASIIYMRLMKPLACQSAQVAGAFRGAEGATLIVGLTGTAPLCFFLCSTEQLLFSGNDDQFGREI